MLPSRALLPARQVARAVLQANASPGQPWIPLHLKRPQQQRLYAMKRRSPTVTRLARSPSSQPQSGPVFSHLDIPPIDVWREFKTHQGLGDLTPEQCLKTITEYCGLATHGSTSWQAALKTDYNIDPYTLHYTALPLITRGMGGRAGHIGVHMLFTASNLGYTPSTLTFVSMFSRSGREKLANSPFKDVLTRFDRLLQTEKNPDAFTLQGLLLLQSGQSTTYALRCFDKAIDAARSLPPSATYGELVPGKNPKNRKPRWFFERACHQKRGEILLQKKRTREALSSFEIAALELDLADGYAELAKLLPHGSKQRTTFLLKAAQGGNFDACGLFALDMADRAAAPGKRWRPRILLRDLAYEWAAIEPEFKKRDELRAQVVEKTGEITRAQLNQPVGPITRFRRWLWSGFP